MSHTSTSSLPEYDIKKRSFYSIGPHLLGLIFIAVGIFTIASPLFMPGNNSMAKAVLVGTAAVIFGLMVVASYSGTLFDFAGKRYKNYYSLSGFRMGQWEQLPPLKLVKIFPHTFSGSTVANGVNPSSTVQVTRYVLALYTDQSKPFMAIEHEDMNRALKNARVLSEQLKASLDIQLSDTDGTLSIKK